MRIAAGEPISNPNLLFTHQELYVDLWMIPRQLNSAPRARAGMSTRSELKSCSSVATLHTFRVQRIHLP